MKGTLRTAEDDGRKAVGTSLMRTWFSWAPTVAGLWSLLYGALGLWWTFGGAGFPFGPNDPGTVSLLGGLRPALGAPLIAGLGLAGAVVALGMHRARARRPVRLALAGFAWLLAATLTLLVSDYRALRAVAYVPVFLLGLPFGWPPVPFSQAIPWPVLNQLLCLAGGVAWGRAAVAYGRRARRACERCGRSDSDAAWTRPAAAAHWGRWAVGVAVAVPLLYALTRWAWAFGVPLGVDEAFLREAQADGFLWAGAALGAVALAGALLTLGLTLSWGEVFPPWLPFLAGRQVPPALAMVPAALVALLVTSAGLMYIRLWLSGFFPPGNPAVYAPELLWPLWGVALAAATLAYGLRRRGPCARCGRASE